MKKKRPKFDDPEQSREFLAAARNAGADTKKTGSDELLGRLAKKPPEPRKKKPKRA